MSNKPDPLLRLHILNMRKSSIFSFPSKREEYARTGGEGLSIPLHDEDSVNRLIYEVSNLLEQGRITFLDLALEGALEYGKWASSPKDYQHLRGINERYYDVFWQWVGNRDADIALFDEFHKSDAYGAFREETLKRYNGDSEPL